MIQTLIIFALAASQALAQGPQKQFQAAPQSSGQSNASQPPSLQRPGETPPAAASTAPSAGVITVRGVCPAETGPATKATVPTTKDCVVTVSKEQFESLLKAFNPGNQAISQSMRRQVAQSYVDLLIFSEAAKAAGVENSPTFQEVMRVLRLKELSEIYRSQLAEQYRNPSQAEMEAYYAENAAKYERARISRIYVPKNNPDPQASAGQKQTYQTKAQQVADDLQARAAKGEPIDKLQKEGYATLGINAAPPATELSPARHGMYPAKLDQDIFSHKAGEVFRADDTNGFMIYRVESRDNAPLDSMKEEISRDITRSKMEQRIKELTGPVHTEFDENYFGPPAPPPAAPGRPQVLNPPK